MKKIYVTSPFLPPIDEYTQILSKAWNKKWLTNDGDLHKDLEFSMAKFIGEKHVSLFNNATIALLVAQKALEFSGEIITTPFSFIATSHAIKWNNLKPVFADTDLKAGNLLVESVEKLINKNTGGILAVHNFGIPGDVKGLQKLSKNYDIPLIYDAAPATGIRHKNKSITKYGDLSVLSFHATKVFTTFEGGAIISPSKKIKNKIDELKNFAIKGPEKVTGLGINGKMNEAEAAMGILQLKYLKENIEKRAKVHRIYNFAFKDINQIRLLNIPENLDYNYAYYPIFFERGKSFRDYIHDRLLKKGIISRKYWFPLISKHALYKSKHNHPTPNALKLSESVLCLPIFPDLKKEDQLKIIKIIIDEI